MAIDKNYFINGISEMLILSILNAHDSYVYEITKAIEQDSNGLLSISQNTTYAATYKLQNEGKISEYKKLVGKRRTRVYYHIEEAGIVYLNELREIYQNTALGVQTIFDTLKNRAGGESNEQDM